MVIMNRMSLFSGEFRAVQWVVSLSLPSGTNYLDISGQVAKISCDNRRLYRCRPRIVKQREIK